MNLIKILEEKHMKERVSDIHPGDTVRVHHKIIEKGREKIQVFEGVVLSYKKRQGTNASIRVRKISMGIGVECTFLIHSPKVTKILVVKRAKVRRAKLYYLRNLRGKSARLKNKEFDSLVVNVPEEEKEEKEEEEKKELRNVKEQGGVEEREERQEKLEEESSQQDNKEEKKDKKQKSDKRAKNIKEEVSEKHKKGREEIKEQEEVEEKEEAKEGVEGIKEIKGIKNQSKSD